MGLELLSRLIQYRDTKANCEAAAGAFEEVRLAWATDTDELGIYTGGAWEWIGSMSAHALVGALHTASGLAVGEFLGALSATTFGFRETPSWSVLINDAGAAVVDDDGDWVMCERYR